MIEKIGKFVDGKVAAGLIAVSSLWSAWGAIANTSNQSKEEISKVLVVDQEGKENTEDKKTIDFQQVRKSWEERKTAEAKNVAGKNLILDEQGVEEYFAQHGTVPYLKNGSTINGDSVDITSRHMEYFCYLSNNDKVYFNPCGLVIDEIHWSWKMVDGKVEIYGHCVIDVKNPKTGGFGDITINNGANFTEENAEGKEIAHTDTLYFQGSGEKLPPEVVEIITKWKGLFEKKVGLPVHTSNPEYLVCVEERVKEEEVLENGGKWKYTKGDLSLGDYWELKWVIKKLECNPYATTEQEIKIWDKIYKLLFKNYCLLVRWTDWSTAHANIGGGTIPSHYFNAVEVDLKEIINTGISSTEIKEPGISSENGTLIIDMQDTPLQSVQIYDLKGQLIAQKSKPEWVENFQLSQGLYFVEWRTVKGESKTVRVMVK